MLGWGGEGDIDAAASSHCSSVFLSPTGLWCFPAVHTHTLTHIYTRMPPTHAQEPLSPSEPSSLPPAPLPSLPSPVFARFTSPPFRWNSPRGGPQGKPTSRCLWPVRKERPAALPAVHPSRAPALGLLRQRSPTPPTLYTGLAGGGTQTPLLDARPGDSGLLPHRRGALPLPHLELNGVVLAFTSCFFP